VPSTFATGGAVPGLLDAKALDEGWIAPGLSITLALNSRGVGSFPSLIRERIARLSYRSIRGRPNCGKTLLSANHVMAEMWSPSSVRTSRPYGRAIAVWGLGK
jgi:hypothetical protein